MNSRVLAGALAVAALVAAPLRAQQDFSQVQIEPVKVAEGIYMLKGSGGNVGLLTGPDGAFLIDDQFAPLSEKILAAVRSLTPEPLRFVVNTHWHGDHTGGNENMGEAGAFLVAHENVRRRMATGTFMKAFNRQVEPAPAGALPVVTFSDAVSFHWNGETIEVVHVQPAHTDGDSVVYFGNANVIHSGDLFFNGTYPYIDTGAGGNLVGMIQGVEQILERCDGKTRIIPGHGPLATREDLERYHRMLTSVRERIEPMVRAGRSRDEAIAAKPTADFDADWGGGFMKPDVWVGLVYDGFQPKDR